MSVRRAFAVAGLVVLVVAAAGVAVLLREPTPRFLERRSSVATVAASEPSIDAGYVLTPVKVVARSGLAVDLVVRRAMADSGRTLPLVLILGGHLTGSEAARLLGETRGMVVAAMSYPFTGDPRPSVPTFLREIPKIRAAFLDTPPAMMLALDHLARLPGVDGSRVDLVGVSLGAPFACIAGALDERFTRVWSLHGSGGSFTPLAANMKRTIGFAPLRVLAAAIANVIIDGPRLDPTKWVGRIAPRPFIMVNAEDDERLPRSAVNDLYRAAREPKEMVWMRGGHIHGDSATIHRLVEIVVARVRATEPREARSPNASSASARPPAPATASRARPR